MDTIFRFHGARVFIQRDAGAQGPSDLGNPGGFPFLSLDQPLAEVENARGVRMRRALEEFNLVFDSNLAPIVGQQVTLSRLNALATLPRVDLLMARAEAGECDLIARTRLAGRDVGLLYIKRGLYRTNRSGSPSIADGIVRSIALSGVAEITFTCTPPGSGMRAALDRNSDGILDGDEVKLR